MAGITLESARNTALVVALVLIVTAAVSAWVIKQVLAKLIAAGMIALLVLVVWSQRRSLDDCADRVQDSLQGDAVDDTTCTFFGRDVTIRGRAA